MRVFLPATMIKKYGPIWLIMFLLTIWVVLMNNWDNPYRRPIIGDAKGYYAYLPAIFIHQDLTFSFVEQAERDYYPADGSLWKDFLVEQPNGTVVNKCFPGVSIFYLPFFLIAYFLSYLLGFPLDGYSVLFQWSIVVAHLFYYAVALLLLNKILHRNQIQAKYRLITLFVLTFGTNVFFYSVFDFSVVHIFGLFGTTLFIYWLQLWNEQLRWSILGKLIVLLALLVIMRPTNALVVLCIPLFVDLRKSWGFARVNFSWRALPYIYVLFSFLMLSIPLVLWKAQTGNWLVYSYGNEKLDFSNPHLYRFLCSVLKGWWFWTPVMLLMFLGAALHFGRKHIWLGVYFVFSVLGIAYVFSSWWIWTYGGGMGQRPMIDFYPMIAVGFAGFLQSCRRDFIGSFVFVPFLLLNMIQAFQINKYILVGGETTWADYKTHFLQLRRTAPEVNIENHWKLLASYKTANAVQLDDQKHYSDAIEIDELVHPTVFVIRLQVSGKHESSAMALVVSDAAAQYYQAEYLGNVLYSKARVLVYRFDIPNHVDAPLRVYLWNGDTDEQAQVHFMEVDVYTTASVLDAR